MAEVTSPPSAEPTLLMLHGLGATSGVWHDLRGELDWPGRIVAPDLPGHGEAAWSGDYTVGALAAGISAACANREPTVVVGHSLGGAVALALASGLFRPVVDAVVAVGVKVRWSDEDVAGMAGVAAKGIRWFDTRAEAVERFLRSAGLVGIADVDHPATTNAVVEEGGRWRVAQDPATFAQRRLDAAGLLAGARCPVVLGAGEHDAMVTEADMAIYSDRPRVAAGRGHNVHVEDPAWVSELIADVLDTVNTSRVDR